MAVTKAKKAIIAVKPLEKVQPMRAYAPGRDRDMAAVMARLEGMPKPVALTSKVNDRGQIAARCENWRRGQ